MSSAPTWSASAPRRRCTATRRSPPCAPGRGCGARSRRCRRSPTTTRWRPRRSGRRPVRVHRLPAPLRLRLPARAPAARRQDRGPAARRPLPDHLVPRHRLLRRALARPLGDRGRRTRHGPRHPPDGPPAGPARPVERGAGDGRTPGARRGDRGRLDRAGPVRERCHGDGRQQCPEPRRGQPHPHRLRTRHCRAHPSLRPQQRELAHHPGPRRAGRRGRRLAGLRDRRAQLAHGAVAGAGREHARGGAAAQQRRRRAYEPGAHRRAVQVGVHGHYGEGRRDRPRRPVPLGDARGAPGWAPVAPAAAEEVSA